MPPLTNRDELWNRLTSQPKGWDLLIIGGGATGAGIAVDAASRGYRTALVDQHDFGKGTSSRSTKLIHGGVRYLQQMNFSLVREALRERALLRQNAPHLVRDLELLIPCYQWWEKTYYGIGLRLYDWLAGDRNLGRSRRLDQNETLGRLPSINSNGLRGGVLYYDGQFDDARLLINLLQTAARHGAAALNYCPVVQLLKENSRVTGAVLRNAETGQEAEVGAKCVVNATGAFVDQVRLLDEPTSSPLVAASQGIHLVFGRRFLPSNTALLVPSTSDDRVLFAIPWHDAVLVGTTDTPLPKVSLEPEPLENEVDFVLKTLAEYLPEPPTRRDIISQFAGIRPLVNRGHGGDTARLSRSHLISVSNSGLVTITGGKWTTYRRMAEDCVDRAAVIAELPRRDCQTRSLRIQGGNDQLDQTHPYWTYGGDAAALGDLDRSMNGLQPSAPNTNLRPAQVKWAVRHEWARTVEDVLARRTPHLLTGAQAAAADAGWVARELASELGRDRLWQTEQVECFRRLAAAYLSSDGQMSRMPDES